MSPRTAAYFSHSYRHEDRKVNQYFWELFWEAGFTFTVDPPSGTLSIPHLELLVRRSDCFVAVVTHHPDDDHYRASPYLVFEYGLAVQANKPRLVFVERQAARHHYEESRRLAFDRAAIAEDRDRHAAAIRRLRDLGAGETPHIDRERGSVGLVLPHGGAYGRAMAGIREVLARAGYDVAVVDHEASNPYRFLVEVDRHDFVVIDVGTDELPSWLYPVLYARLVPMVRLLHHEPGRAPARLPRLGLGHAIESVARADELAISWSGVDELLPKLDREVRALEPRPEDELGSWEQGLGYFNGLGRPADTGVFVSNARASNDLAGELCRELRTSSVRLFHYVFENTIELGRPWPRALGDRLRASQLFLPLITPSYWESDVCREEFRMAEELCRQGRLRMLPYFVEPGGRRLPIQGRSLHRLPRDRWVDQIMADVDGCLTSGSVPPEVRRGWWCDVTGPPAEDRVAALSGYPVR